MSAAADGSAPVAHPPSHGGAFEHAPIGMVLLDGDGVIVAVNAAASVLLDAPEVELLGVALSSRAHPDDVGAAPERRYRREDGSVVIVRELTSDIPGSRPPTRVVTLEDVTQRQLVTERLRTQTALAYLGEMASVIAHEVRNAFAGIRGAVEVIGQDLPPGSEERDAVDQVRRRIGGLEDTVDELLRFARMRPPRLSGASIRDVTGEVARGLSFSVPSARVVVSGPDLMVYADRDLLAFALANVCLNVAHALAREGGGEVSIEVEVARSGDTAELRVGGGQERVPALDERLLRPFFTRRGGGPVGLPIAKRILEAQGADLSIEERAGASIVVVRIALALRAGRKRHGTDGR